MQTSPNLWRAIIAIAVLATVLTGIFVSYEAIVSLPFRETNDLLHRENSPVTLDLFIPGGVYVDPTMTIEQVLQLRFEKPKNKIAIVVEKISEAIPTRYKVLGTGLLYLFWTIATLAVLRVLTWMRYGTAMATAFLFGAFLYYFMPDLVAGRVDDLSFAAWSLFFAIVLRQHRKRHKAISLRARKE